MHMTHILRVSLWRASIHIFEICDKHNIKTLVAKTIKTPTATISENIIISQNVIAPSPLRRYSSKITSTCKETNEHALHGVRFSPVWH